MNGVSGLPWYAGPTTRQHQPGRTMSIASLVAPPWQHEPVPATAPELGRHRRESLRSTRQWAELQRQQQRLIACHSDWMRSFRQRMAFAARGCKLGGISAAGVPMVADTALSFGAPQVHKLEVHPDKDGTGAVLMLNGGVELRIMVKSK